MKLTCEQMDVLISFYIDNELNKNMRIAVEDHLKTCFPCKTKYEIIKSLSENMAKECPRTSEFTLSVIPQEKEVNTAQYKVFKKNLSAYIDNELSEKDSLKIKKIIINNKSARKDLENSYKLKHLLNTSAEKTRNYLKQDFSRKILSQLNPSDNHKHSFSNTLKFVSGFLTSVIVISAIIVINLNS